MKKLINIPVFKQKSDDVLYGQSHDTYLSQETEGCVEVSRADSNHDQQAPDHVDSSTTVSRVVSVEDHEEGGHDKEENIGDSVDELCHVGSVGVVVLAPINR